MADEENFSTPFPPGQSSQASDGVLNAKLARRKLQHDVELLSNRVERLREEELVENYYLVVKQVEKVDREIRELARHLLDVAERRAPRVQARAVVHDGPHDVC